MVRAKLIPERREMLLGHALPGNDGSYYRPDEDEILEEYLKAVDLLTINEENRLKRKVETLESQKSKIDTMQSEIKDLRNQWNNMISDIYNSEDRKLSAKYVEDPNQTSLRCALERGEITQEQHDRYLKEFCPWLFH